MTLHYWLARLGQRIQWSWLRVIGAISFFPLGLGIVVWPTATLIYVLVFLLLLLTFIQPYVALILTFLCIGFQGSGFQYYFQGWSWVVPGYTVPVLFGLTAWSAARIAGIIEPHRSTTLDLPLLVLWVTGLLALTWSRYWFDGVHVLVMHTTSYALFLLISLNCRAPVQAISLYWVWWGLGLVMVGIIITSFFTGYAYSQYLTENLKFFSVLNQADGSRNSFHGTMSVTKGVTFVMNHAIFCALAIIGTRKNRWAITIAWSSIVAFLFVHLLTQSRLELVGLCLGWAVFVYLMPQWWESKLQKSSYAFLTLATGLMLTLAVLHTFFNLTEFVARFTGREATLPGTPFSAAQGRKHYISFGLTAVAETGGWGAGAGGIMREVMPTLGGMMPSLYLTVMTDHGYGILSLLLLGWIVINLILELRKALRRSTNTEYAPFLYAIIASLVAYGFAGLLDYNYYIHEVWILLGFAVATVRATNDSKRSRAATTASNAEG